jgi:hypothetical protein
MIRTMLCGAAIVGFVAFAPGNPAHALHDGGVAHCDSCHTMHRTPDGQAESGGVLIPYGTANDQLLKGTDASSTCLNCHNGSGGYHINSTDGSNTNAGGDFYWVLKDYAVAGGWPGAPVVTYLGDDHGHNIVAADYGFAADADPDNAQSPGGSYDAADLGCNSCHDPHGTSGGGTAADLAAISASGSYGDPEPTDGSRLGNYRLLRDGGSIDPGGAVFVADAPIAAASGSDGASVNYGSGMSEWCGTCHADIQVFDSTKHPSGDGVHLGSFVGNYNSYVATGDFNGDVLTAFDGLIPIERGVTTGGWDLDPLSTAGADGASNVSCLTCHRAHASANANAGRWDFEVELLVDSHALKSADVTPGSAVYYKDGVVVDIATDYDPWQRSLCNKCHVKD